MQGKSVCAFTYNFVYAFAVVRPKIFGHRTGVSLGREDFFTRSMGRADAVKCERPFGQLVGLHPTLISLDSTLTRREIGVMQIFVHFFASATSG
jgi:hypothetical protein